MKKRIDIRAAVIARRDELGWTNYRLAKEAGLPPSDVARWLDDTTAYHRPHLTTARLEPILLALGLRIKHDSRS
jgi:hypothetical protein